MSVVGLRCHFCGREVVPGTILCDRCINWTTNHPFVDPLAVIGRPPEHRDWPIGKPGILPLIDYEARIEALCTVDAGMERATRIGRSWLMKGVHVGHDAYIGHDCELAPHTSVGGHVTIWEGVRVGQGATFKPRVTVGAGARIGMGAVVIRDVPPRETWAGNPARLLARSTAQP